VRKSILCCFLLLPIFPLLAQKDPSSQTPKTAPQVQEALASYEGQSVAVIELAGQPNLDVNKFLPLLSLKAG